MKLYNKKLIEECYQKSVELLKNNSSDFGTLASSPQERATQRNYLSIFGRDAGICALGMVASGDKKLIKIARESIDTLIRGQAIDGQIPNYVKPQKNYVDFWRMGCIDATLWCLIAIKFFDNYAGYKVKLEDKYKKHILKALYWLKCQKHEQDKLVMQNEASDWADLMPRTGKVLYSNALWYQVSLMYDLKITKTIKKNFNLIFYPYKSNLDKVMKCDLATVTEIQELKPKKYYISYLNYLHWGRDVDVFGNSLSIIFKLPSKKIQTEIVDYLLNHPQKKDLPKPVVFNPIKEDSEKWHDYMESHGQDYPYKYHNGGVWPFASCFWAMALAGSGKKQEAWKEMEKIAEVNSRNDWHFQEWFHAKTGRAYGMQGQSWNAGAFLLAYHFIKKEVKL